MAISVIEFPNGKFGFVGSVPVNLAYRFVGGFSVDREKVREAVSHCGPGLAKKLAKKLGVDMQEKTFSSRAQAYMVARDFCVAHNLDVKVFSVFVK